MDIFTFARATFRQVATLLLTASAIAVLPTSKAYGQNANPDYTITSTSQPWVYKKVGRDVYILPDVTLTTATSQLPYPFDGPLDWWVSYPDKNIQGFISGQIEFVSAFDPATHTSWGFPNAGFFNYLTVPRFFSGPISANFVIAKDGTGFFHWPWILYESPTFQIDPKVDLVPTLISEVQLNSSTKVVTLKVENRGYGSAATTDGYQNKVWFGSAAVAPGFVPSSAITSSRPASEILRGMPWFMGTPSSYTLQYKVPLNTAYIGIAVDTNGDLWETTKENNWRQFPLKLGIPNPAPAY